MTVSVAALVEVVRVLILEDMPEDAKLMENELRKAGYDVEALRVDGRAAFVEGLDTFKPDLILADQHLPTFDGSTALQLTRSMSPETPFVFVTGTMGEEKAVQTIEEGAAGYVLKDNMIRLASVVKKVFQLSEELKKRKDAEEALRASEERFQLAMRGASDGLWDWNVAANDVYYSPHWNSMLGYGETDIGRTLEAWTSLIHPDDVQNAMLLIQDLFEKRTDKYEIEFRMRHKKGHYVDILARAFPVRDAQGRLTRLVGTHVDISEKKKSEQALREAKERTESILESVADVHTVLDRDWRYIYVNRAAVQALARTTGKPGQKILGSSLWEILPDIVGTEIESNYRRTMEQRVPTTFESYHAQHDTWWENRFYPVTEGLAVFASDVSSRKRSERSLLRVNRALKALGGCNEILARASNEKQMLADMCRSIVQTAEYQQAWVGLIPARNALEAVAAFGYGGEEDLAAAQALATGLPERALETLEVQWSADAGSDTRLDFWKAQAEQFCFGSFLIAPLVSGDANLGILCIFCRETRAFDEEEIRVIREMANDVAYGMVALRANVAHRSTEQKLHASMRKTIQAIAGTVEMRDLYTAGHERRVSILACAIARKMGLPDETVQGIHLASIVHDLGKINIPAEILSKPAHLADLEFKLVQTHCQSGFDILKDIDFPWPIAQIVYQHHERIDGSGYPRGLKGDEIILEARIVAVADTVEAMASHRPYRAGLGLPKALDEIEKNRGKTYDATVVDACLKLFRDGGFSFDSTDVP